MPQPAGARRPGANPSPERAGDGLANRQQCRRNARTRARDDRQTGDRENHAPVDRDLDPADARQREIGEEPAKAGGDADAGKSAEKGQQNALDQAELEQPARARAESFPNRHVAS